MISKECLKRIDERNYLTQRERKDFLNIVEKDLDILEIIKKHSFLFVEKGKLYVGRYADVELLLEEDDFENKQEYELLKEWLEK